MLLVRVLHWYFMYIYICIFVKYVKLHISEAKFSGALKETSWYQGINKVESKSNVNKTRVTLFQPP